MFTTTRSACALTRTRKPAGVKPALEALEDRTLPAATYLVLDFSNDYNVSASLTNSFNAARASNGLYPRFLDMDGSGGVSLRDVQICAQAVTNRVAQLFSRYAPLGVRVVGGDFTGNQRYGYQWLNYGKYYSNVHVSVMYFGGYRSYAWGIAPLAQAGYNVEGFGRVFSDGHARYFSQRAAFGYRVTSADFVNALAATAAHEMGHMLGLRHVPGVTYHIMNPGDTRDHNRAYFPNAWYNTEGGGPQNADQELIASFRGQRTIWSNTGDWQDAIRHARQDNSGPGAVRLTATSPQRPTTCLKWAPADPASLQTPRPPRPSHLVQHLTYRPLSSSLRSAAQVQQLSIQDQVFAALAAEANTR
jgi:hypothetical protein